MIIKTLVIRVLVLGSVFLIPTLEVQAKLPVSVRPSTQRPNLHVLFQPSNTDWGGVTDVTSLNNVVTVTGAGYLRLNTYRGINWTWISTFYSPLKAVFSRSLDLVFYDSIGKLNCEQMAIYAKTHPGYSVGIYADGTFSAETSLDPFTGSLVTTEVVNLTRIDFCFLGLTAIIK